MKIERVRVGAFGRLVDYDSGPDPLPGLVVVLGPNEAGKSTLFQCLTTLLYGFRPASRENNPYAPWGGLDLEAEAVLRLDGGTTVEVGRRLLSQPTGRMDLDGRVEDLRNRPVPWAEHVPLPVFRQVFALTLADLAELDEETWGRVQDRIVGAMGASDVASAREVAAELEREAGELWRPSRRGNQRIRRIQEELRALRTRRREALDRDVELRRLVAERDGKRRNLQAAREDRQCERIAVERVQDLLPIRRQLRRIETLREQAGSPEALTHLPSDPAGALRAFARRGDELTRRCAGLEQEAREPERILAAYGRAEADLLARAEAISEFRARAEGATFERARARGLEQEIRELDGRLDSEAQRVLSTPWRDAPAERFAALAVDEVREAVEAFLRAEEEVKVLQEAETRRADTRPTGRRLVLAASALTIVAAGVVLGAVGAHTGNRMEELAGVLLAAAGVVLLATLRRGSGTEVEGGAAERARAATATRERAHARLAEVVGGLRVSSALIERPSAFLVSGLETLAETQRSRSERLRALEGIRERLGRLDAEARTLLPLPDDGDVPDAEATVRLLERELGRAERARDAARGAERELGRIARERARIEEERTHLDGEIGELERRLSELGHGDLERGAREASTRIQAARRADELQDELERSHPSLDDAVTRIAEAERSGESWTMDDEDLARRNTRIEALSEEIEQLAAQNEAIGGAIARLRELETVDAVDGEAATLQEEEARLTVERDRRWVLSVLLREADRRFREEHQPDLIRRASAYLAHLTDGRYDRILADETARGNLFHVYGPALPAPVELAPPVSTGTLEQAYLSLRLAIVDHLDEGGERLPLFVDEVFVNWDEARRARGMDVLAGVAATRQLFVFTCHRQLAEDLAGLGARILELVRG